MPKQSWMRPATMPMDAYRHDNHLVITFDVPGVDAGAVELTVEGNALKVVSPRPRPAGEVTWLTAERPYGTSTCELHLGDGVDLDALTAHCANGVLTITIPVAEGTSRRIEVTSGDRQVESPVENVESPAAA